MLRSMYSGVSGLKTHQTKLDVIGNNIANVNTVAYKSSSVTFQEVLSQTVASAQPPTNSGTGGTNPSQVGLGTAIGAISTNHANGNIQTTDSITDLALDGGGFFVVNDGLSNSYTRAGNFSIDSAGNLVTVNGEKVMGWNKGTNDEIDTSMPLESISLSSLTMKANSTSELNFEGNLDSKMENGDSFEYNMTLFDSLGEAHSITLKFERAGTAGVAPKSLTFNYYAEDSEGNSIGSGNIEFDNEGKLTNGATGGSITLPLTGVNGANDITSELNFDENKFTLYSNTTVVNSTQDGYEAGSLIGLGVDQEGKVIGNFSNGRDNHVSTIAVASFINPQGLEKVGGNLFATSWNSGEPQIGMAGTGERGSIASSSLEMANVDLSREFTEMIVAQRGFQANSKIITTSDEVLQELVNLKR
ncbi:MAG: flagellar hook protein FlgE [Bacillota bacterium]|nr:flagellar hook protein FlgE [Bacillota bacterium]